MANKNNNDNQKNESTTLAELLKMKLKALLDTEAELVKALPKMAKKATDPDLARGFEEHLEQTKAHEERARAALEKLGAKPQKLQGDAIRGIVADAEWTIKNVEGDEVLDAALIASAQYAEHYEIAGYGSAIEWAKLLGEDDVVNLLEQTLEEEKEADEKLTKLAEVKVNERAMEGVAMEG